MKPQDTPIDLHATFDRLRATCADQPFPSWDQRAAWLRTLQALLTRHEVAIAQAIDADFGGRPAMETELAENWPSLEEIKCALRHGRQWMKPRRAGVSRWFLIDQKRIATFAENTEDMYFIHTDPARAAKETPFDGTIAHGFLTLSMMSAMAYDALPDIEGRVMGMNYGLNKIRFLSPVPAGSRIRGRFVLSDVQRKSDREIVITHQVTVEIEGKDKPALAAEWLGIGFLG